MCGRYNFTYKKFIDLLKDNEDNCGDKKGDNGQKRDALILLYFLMQKYDYNRLLKVIKEMEDLSETGLDNILSQVIKNHLWDY